VTITAAQVKVAARRHIDVELEFLIQLPAGRLPCEPPLAAAETNSCRRFLRGAADKPRDGLREPLPVGGFSFQVLAALARQRVVLGAPVMIALAPLRFDQALRFQFVQRGIQSPCCTPCRLLRSR
jgi:hypothetical protein